MSHNPIYIPGDPKWGTVPGGVKYWVHCFHWCEQSKGVHTTYLHSCLNDIQRGVSEHAGSTRHSSEQTSEERVDRLVWVVAWGRNSTALQVNSSQWVALHIVEKPVARLTLCCISHTRH